MITKGIITSIDFNGNTCQVRIPLFETSGNDPITGTAIVSNTPGSYNGYKVGDVVLVAFEDGKMQNPVIVGKLYLGAAKEKQDPRGTINVETTTASKSASLPADAVLTANVDSNVPNTNTPFGSLASIANNLNSLNTDVNQLDRFTRNQFNSVITDVNDQGEQLRSEIKQTAKNIEANVVHIHEDGSQDALGWDLTTDGWKINAQDTINGVVKDINIVTIGREGMTIAGDLKLNGYPKNIIVRYTQNDSDTTYPDLYSFKAVSFPTFIDKTWYYGKYIKITEAGEEKYVLVSKENIEQYDIKTGMTIAYSREINSSWSTETPERVDGKYIWQWTHTEAYLFDKNNDVWIEKDDDKVVCITGARGETGTAINNNKQWYILWPASTSTNPTKPTNNEEPTEPATPSTVEKWMSTPPEAVNGYVVWTCYGSIFSDDTAENRHIEYSDPVKDNAYALAQGKTTNYYSDTDPSKAYSVKKGDCWFKTISSTNDEYNNEMPDQNQGKLYQCSGFDTNGKAIWEDVGGELVANKLTANYINALDITARKIQVKDTNGNTLFKANGISGEADSNKVTIGGFNVDSNSIKNGDLGTANSVLVSTGSGENVSIGASGKMAGWAFAAGTNFGVTNIGNLYASAGKIGGWTINSDELSGVISNANIESSITLKPDSLKLKGRSKETASFSTKQAEGFYLGLDATDGNLGLGVFGSKITRVFVKTFGNGWDKNNITKAEVPGILPHWTHFSYYEVPNLIIYVTGKMVKDTYDIDLANWESCNVQNIIGAVVMNTDGKSPMGYKFTKVAGFHTSIQIQGKAGLNFFALIFCYATVNGVETNA